VALAILQKIERQRQFADEAVDQLIEKASPTKLDRGLIFELVFGVLRYRETLDWRLNLLTNQPMSRLPIPVAMTLRLGAYQILYLDRIPQSAAVNESVNLSRSIRGRDWTGFVNGVLRNLLRQTTPPWPDPSENHVLYLSIRYSCPQWLVARWLSVFGSAKTELLCQATLNIPPITLRTNTLRCTREELATRLRDEGYDVQETLVSPVGLILKKCGKLSDVKALQDGWCYVEDEAAQLVPLLLEVSPEHRILDVCAAPGGKTTHLAARMQNQGNIVALDQNPGRLRVLASNCQRLGVTNVSAFVGDASQNLPHTDNSNPLPSALSQGFDGILCDAPCSGLGVLRRNPEGKWAKDPDLIIRAQARQLAILNHVCPLLRPDGVLVYSACSSEAEETYQVLATFCRQHPEFRHESVGLSLPLAGHSLIDQEGNLFTAFNPFDMDGFFAARLRKVGS
jgi:16S rRNA (cytosine967-C5)-methyltransferase